MSLPETLERSAFPRFRLLSAICFSFASTHFSNRKNATHSIIRQCAAYISIRPRGSARARSIGGTMTPSAFAVARLTPRENCVGSSTGRSVQDSSLENLVSERRGASSSRSSRLPPSVASLYVIPVGLPPGDDSKPDRIGHKREDNRRRHTGVFQRKHGRRRQRDRHQPSHVPFSAKHFDDRRTAIFQDPRRATRRSRREWEYVPESRCAGR